MKALKTVSILFGIILTTATANAANSIISCDDSRYPVRCTTGTTTRCCTNNTCNDCATAGSVGEQYTKCDKGYYYDSDYYVCAACTGDGTSNGDTSQDPQGVYACYVPKGTTFSDNTGSGEYVSDCQWSDQRG